MPIAPTWQDIAIRLALSVLAGGLIGLNRGGHGRPAGLRTNLLVCLAAALSMILANLLLESPGGEHDQTLRMDVMRLPLGILTGVGFIGAGAILRRGDLVLGVTTAATLWYVTMLGLCFGADRLGLGVAGLALGLIVLWGLRFAERLMKQERHASLTVTCDGSVAAPSEADLRGRLEAAGLKVASAASHYGVAAQRTLTFDVRWLALEDTPIPPIVDAL
ncbi:MAG TPA: MgtC/SapB family protein, partial [Hyphomicrobiales bacterium]|nr:MgtC/SapB family protein [Hyphomicrobiales bacterium]